MSVKADKSESVRQKASGRPWSVFPRRKPKRRHSMISLFSGCGGLDLGFRYAGFDISWANDIDGDACETYRKNLGIVVKEGDINKIDFPNRNDLDMLAACFPCQPFSNAGARRGNDDDRALNQVALDAVKQLRPKAAIFENVRGMLSVKIGKIFLIEKFCRCLSALGYDSFVKLMDASQHRVGQRRLRVFIVAIRADKRLGRFAFPSPKPPHGLTLGDTLTGIAPDVCNQKEVICLSPQAAKLCSLIPPGGSWKSVDGRRLPKRLKNLKKIIDRYRAPNFYRRFAADEIAGTITAEFKPEKSGVMHPQEPRPYTVRETARIQSFPDWFAFHGKSERSKYRQIGNAVPPRLAYEIAGQISRVLDGESPEGVSEFLDIGEFLKKGEPLRVVDAGLTMSAREGKIAPSLNHRRKTS